MDSFAAIPATVERLLTGASEREPLASETLGALDGRYERVLVVYFDAFGWWLAERHAGHSLLARAHEEGVVRKLTSQFPSTTAAHTTTIHSGLPVSEHGVYEWFVLEPSLDRLIAPLLFSFAGDKARETLRATALEPADVFPTNTIYRRLAAAGVLSHVAQSAEFTPSSASDLLLRGANVLPFTRQRDGLAEIAAALSGPGPAYGLVYLDELDALMHVYGPADPRVDDEVDATLTSIERALAGLPEGTLVLLTADHGMSPVAPKTTIYVNTLWPELERHLRRGSDGKPLAPAGSCRDLFLHVLPGHLEDACAGLRDRLHGRAEVLPVAALLASGAFGPTPSDRLLERLGDVVVLPEVGEATFWLEPGRFEQHLRGQHGGLSPVEREIPLVAFVSS